MKSDANVISVVSLGYASLAAALTYDAYVGLECTSTTVHLYSVACLMSHHDHWSLVAGLQVAQATWVSRATPALPFLSHTALPHHPAEDFKPPGTCQRCTFLVHVMLSFHLRVCKHAVMPTSLLYLILTHDWHWLTHPRLSNCLLTNVIAGVTSSFRWQNERHHVLSYVIVHLSIQVGQPLAQGQPL